MNTWLASVTLLLAVVWILLRNVCFWKWVRSIILNIVLSELDLTTAEKAWIIFIATIDFELSVSCYRHKTITFKIHQCQAVLENTYFCKERMSEVPNMILIPNRIPITGRSTVRPFRGKRSYTSYRYSRSIKDQKDVLLSMRRKTLEDEEITSKIFETQSLSHHQEHTKYSFKSSLLQAACYWSSSYYILVQTFLSVLGELNDDRSPWVLDSGKEVHFHCSSSYYNYMKGIDSHNRVDEDVTVRSCRITRFHLSDDLVLLASSEKHEEHALNRFSAAWSHVAMKVSGTLKRPMYYVSPEKWGSFCCKQIAIRCGKWRRSSTLACYSRVMEDGR